MDETRNGQLPGDGLTEHVKVRCQQRGIPISLLRFVLEFGQEYRAPGGALAYFFGRRSLNRSATFVSQRLDRLLNTALIIVDGRFVTAFKASKPQRNWRLV